MSLIKEMGELMAYEIYERLSEQGMTKGEIADVLGVSRSQLYTIINNRKLREDDN